ncbi:MAG: hypothetical protein ACJ70W_09140, partial [Nitrososphaera sp.]
MTYLKNTKKNKDNNNNNSNRLTATTTISVLTLAIIIMMVAPTSIDTPVAAQQVTTTRAAGGNTTTASSSTSPSGIDLSSSQPVYQERSPPGGLIPINETHGILTFSGNGTITLPNSTQAINTTSNGTGIISFATTSGYAKETIRAENGETVTATTYEIVQFNNPAAAPQGGGKGIVTAVFQTNSTGTLAPLNGMILAGIDNLSSSGESHVTLWRWESGITNTTSASVTRSSNNSTGMSA